MRMADREHIMHSGSMATHADARGKRLTVRFRATRVDTPETRRGFVGQIDASVVKAKVP